MATPLRVLILEDHPSEAELMMHELRRADIDPDWQRVETEPDYLTHLDPPPDVILADYALPQFDALAALHLIQERQLDIPFIVVTGRVSEEVAVECMKLGAADYLLKDRLARLGPAVLNAIAEKALRDEKKQTENALVQSEQRYRTIFEGVQDAILIESLNGEILDVNTRACEMFGWTREEFLTKSVSDLVPEEHPRVVPSEMNGAPIPEMPVETVNVRANGERFPIELTARLQNLGGKTVMLLVIRDITERARAQQAIRESEERFRSVAETAADGIVLTNSKDVIQYWNPAAERIFGYSSKDALGKSIDMLLSSDSIEARREIRERIRRSGEGSAFREAAEFEGVRKSGVAFPLDMSIASWKSDGERFFTCIMRDLTKARQAQQRAELQDRLAAVGQLAAGIAHDFNNILGTIILYSQLLLDGQVRSPEDQEQLSMICNQAQRGALLVSQILDFSRRSIMERHPIDLLPFLKEMEKLLARTLPASIQIKLRSEGDRFVLMADPTRMQQVIMNLALNARDAMPEGGELSIDLAHFEINHAQKAPLHEMEPGDWIRISVADSGAGITPDSLPHIFEPFFTTKPAGQGTGLGLAQVYGIVKQHDGFIKVESEEGRGTSFTIYLPAASEELIPSLIQDANQAEAGGGETILVVEDDEATRTAIREILSAMDYRVLHASNGAEALAIYEQDGDQIDLVLSDLVMPDIGGRALFQALVEKHPGVRMVLMTGYPPGPHTKALLDRRQVSWLQKPFSSLTIARTIREALTRNDDSNGACSHRR